MKKPLSAGIALVLACMTIQPAVYAENKDIQDAYNFYGEKQIDNYCEGAGWEAQNINSFTWYDSKNNYLCRNSSGFQYDAYKDIMEALIKELKESGDDSLTMETDESGESDFGKVAGNIPDYSEYVNEVNSLIKTALAECGEGENPEYSDKVKYNTDLGLQDGKPWSAAFICWCADKCGLLNDTFGPARALCSDLYNDLTGKGYESYICSSIEQWGGNGYIAVPGDIIFWRGEADTEYTRAGIITETGDDYIVITQGNTASGHVLPITYESASKEFSKGSIVHVVYPNCVFNGDSLAAIIGFLRAQGFNNAAILGILGNMDAESGLIPYRCQNDQNNSNAYADSYSYTKAVDSGEISKTEFTTMATGYFSTGYGLVQFTYYAYKEQLYDLAKKMKTSVGDPEVQLITLMDIWKKERITIDKTYNVGGRDDAITRDFLISLGFSQYDETNTYDLLHKVPDTDDGAQLACNIMMSIFEKPEHFKLGERIGRMAKYESDVMEGGSSNS